MGGALTRMLGLNPAVGGAISARYWRWRFPDGSYHATDLGIAELEMRATEGGADLTSTGGASASSHNPSAPGFPASQAFNNSVTTEWFAASGSTANAWIACDLGSATDIAEFFVTAYQSDLTAGPETIVVEYSFDGSTWFQDTRWPSLTSLKWGQGPSSSGGSTKLIRRAAGTPPVVLNAAKLEGMNEDTNGWNGFTLRQVISVNQMPGAGDRIRFRLRSGNAEGLNINKCYIGIKGAGTYDFATTPTQVTFNGGSTSFSIAAATNQQSDDIALTIGSSDSLVISMYCNSASDTFRRANSSSNGSTSGFKSGDSASSVTVTGYTGQNRMYLNLLEVWYA